LAAQTAVAAALPQLQIQDKLESGHYPPLAMTAFLCVLCASVSVILCFCLEIAAAVERDAMD
jgi:hypothetical protein